MNYLGDFAPTATVRAMWNSSDANGASITRATNGTISVYKDGGLTQSTTGVTDTEDFDGLTGVHLVAIDTSSDGSFYAAGSDFIVVLSGAVIDTRTVNAVLFSFSLNNRTALRPATAGRTLVVDASGLADANAVKVGPTGAGTAQTARDIGASVLLSSGTGTGQVKLASGYVAPNWGDVGNPTATNNLSGTTIKTATDVATATTNIQADTDDIQTRLPAALVSGRMDASVGAMASGVLTATAIGADAITAAKVADGTIDAATFAAGAINAAAIATDAITAAKIAADAIGASELATDAVTEIQSGLGTAAVLTAIQAKTDLIPGTIDGKTFSQLVTLMAAVLLGKASGLPLAPVYRAVNDSKDRVSATTDVHGNRTAVTLDAS